MDYHLRDIVAAVPATISVGRLCLSPRDHQCLPHVVYVNGTDPRPIAETIFCGILARANPEAARCKSITQLKLLQKGFMYNTSKRRLRAAAASNRGDSNADGRSARKGHFHPSIRAARLPASG